jgi:hypothetical protein
LLRYFAFLAFGYGIFMPDQVDYALISGRRKAILTRRLFETALAPNRAWG